MQVSISWLKELVDLKVSIEELVRLLPLRTIGLKEVTDDFFELDMKGYNRADLLSMRGVAREVTAITDSRVKFDADLRGGGLATYGVNTTPVKVEDPKLCPVYCIAKIEGLKSSPSNPDWVKKLADSGMRTVNNIADVTNLIMFEFGQPMHAFDADKVADETLIVRTARQGETLATLDNKVRKLSTDDLLIADPTKPLGLAGVMGGKESEVSGSTTTILLEAAIFDPVSIRRSSKRHGLYSEASKRFQHGLTKTNLLQALSAAIKMYEGLGGKLTALTLSGNLEDKPKTIKLTQEKINSLIGVKIPPEVIESSLKSLRFKLALHLESVKQSAHVDTWKVLSEYSTWDVTPPYWRLDINIEEDLVEEVTRMYGYEKIPPQKLRGKLPEKLDESLQNLIYDLKVALKDAGLTEVQTYSFYSSQVTRNLEFKTENLIKIANPISSETEFLRDQLWPNLLEVVSKNIRQGYDDIAIFEIGKVYSPKKGELPDEKYHVAIALMNGEGNPMAELTSISRGLKLVHPKGVQVQLGGRHLFHPVRFTETMAEVHPRILNKFGIEKRVAIFEIELEPLVKV